jgi:5-hydroxyisourate hydrolase
MANGPGVSSGGLPVDHGDARDGGLTALSTHILDLAAGRPAADVGVRLFSRHDPEPRLQAERRTDGDGRARLIEPGRLTAGPWRLAFDIGAYFVRTGADLAEPPFLDVVVIDFAVADPGRHYHVPLLVSPFGYSTYRGS